MNDKINMPLTENVIKVLNELDLDSLRPNDRIAFAYKKGDKEKLR